MNFNSFLTSTPSFKQFLYILASAVRLHQPIAFYYDLSIVPKINRTAYHRFLSDEYEKYYNITFFSDFVPGFLTNPDGATLLSRKPSFAFIIFLNFDPQNSRQTSLLNELRIYKYNYILISKEVIDLVAFSPFLYLNIDLTNFGILRLVNFYIFKYLEFFIDPSKHDIKYDKLIKNAYNFNMFFLIVILKKKVIVQYYYKNYIKKRLKKIKTIVDLVNCLLVNNTYKRLFKDKFYNRFVLKVLKKPKLKLKFREVFLKSIKCLYKKIIQKRKDLKNISK